jgi:hypothetical protein
MTPDQWLTEYLTDHGPTLSSDVKLAGSAAGYSGRTLIRAMHRIGQTTGAGPATQWELTAPQPGQDRATTAVTSDDAPAIVHQPCPACGYRWPVPQAEPLPSMWCSYCGNRWSP